MDLGFSSILQMTSVERVIEYIDLKPEDLEHTHPFISLPPQWPTGGIVFENFSFRYSSTAPWVLKNINIAIQPNEKVSFCLKSPHVVIASRLILDRHCWSNRRWKKFDYSIVISYGGIRWANINRRCRYQTDLFIRSSSTYFHHSSGR